ncbi:dehydrogenase/reductase SDR family member 9-like [Anneissia japonica]|uniref:dehydrogenase/reductase SDR family member 9-like n=1 Tax=Anneissia japonica TaxID=1529436 RepID=UPI001425A58F|nr:dehydrogenase/reductase SDR family member 9-like [Anneissia japonica]XP_033120923.1 dehydrogenase/reductase SDR family member 9-like [Anneissia japonica]
MDFMLSIGTIGLLWIAIVWVLRMFHVSNINEKHVLITGCDTGFGNMLAKRLDKRGFAVIAACLHKQSLEELTSSCSKRLCAVQMDIREKEDIQRTFELVKQRLPPGRGLWALVNNAGVAGAYVPFDWMNQEEWNRVLQVNFFGLVNMTTIFAPLIKKEKGRVVNVSSITGRIAISGCGYSTSKFAVEGFTDCLRVQLRNFGVTTCLIEPGFFKTKLMDGIAAQREYIWQNLPDNIKAEYGQQYYEKTVKSVQASTDRIKEERSSMVVDAMEHSVSCWWPKSRYVVGWEAWFFFRILSFFPAGLTDIIMIILFSQPAPAPSRKG